MIKCYCKCIITFITTIVFLHENLKNNNLINKNIFYFWKLKYGAMHDKNLINIFFLEHRSEVMTAILLTNVSQVIFFSLYTIGFLIACYLWTNKANFFTKVKRFVSHDQLTCNFFCIDCKFCTNTIFCYLLYFEQCIDLFHKKTFLYVILHLTKTTK